MTIPMPEPFTFFHGYRTQDLNGNRDDKPPMPYVGLPLFTTTQAEAYAAARVREALEEAIAAVESCRTSGTIRYGTVDDCIQSIRTLIPKE